MSGASSRRPRSPSMRSSTSRPRWAFAASVDKMQVVADLCAALAASARRIGDAFGLIGCDEKIVPEFFLPATARAAAKPRWSQRLRAYEPAGHGAARADRRRGLLAGRRKLVFVISDFYMPLALIEAPVRGALAARRRAHRAEGSARDEELPRYGLVSLTDLETGRRRLLAHAAEPARGMATEERSSTRALRAHRHALRAAALRDPGADRLGSARRLSDGRSRVRALVLALLALADGCRRCAGAASRVSGRVGRHDRAPRFRLFRRRRLPPRGRCRRGRAVPARKSIAAGARAPQLLARSAIGERHRDEHRPAAAATVSASTIRPSTCRCQPTQAHHSRS